MQDERVSTLLSEIHQRVLELQEPGIFDWSNSTPDEWVTQIMTELRVAAVNIVRWRKMRAALVTVTATCIVAILKGEELFHEYVTNKNQN